MQNTPKIIVLSFLAIFIAGGFMLATPTAQAAGTITLTQTSNVVVTFVSSSADFNNLFGISSPVARSFGYGHNTSSGATFNVDNVASGSELVFYITNGDGQTFYSGSASRNQDNTDHANVTSLGNNQWQIGFEDQLNGGDRDYNDIIIRVSATTACTANASKLCVGNNVYWYDSCNVQGSLFQTCNANQTCQNAQCVNNAPQYCANGTTMTPQEVKSAMEAGKLSFSWNNYGNTATAHISNSTNCTVPFSLMSYKQFSWGADRLDTSVFVASSGVANINQNGTTDISVPVTGSCLNIVALWYNHGPQQMHDSELTPVYGIPNVTAYTPFNTQTPSTAALCTNSPTCTPNASQKCVGNSVYNFDSCNIQGSLVQTCNTNQTCSNGSCVNSCTANTTKKCVGNSVYWFDSCNTQGSLFQTCGTNQTCANGSCSTVSCNTNSDCGNNSVTGSPFCQNSNVYQNYNTYTCNNPGTTSSYCSTSTSAQLQTTCGTNQQCSNGSCSSYNNISLSCYATPNPVNVNQSVTFYCNVSGGSGAYTFSWSGACTSSSQNCTASFSNAGTQIANVTVTSAGQTQTTSTSVVINGNNNNYCTYHSYQRCVGNNLYWYDSCGNQQDVQYCSNGCYGNTCSNYNYNYNYNYNNNCTYHAYERCTGNSLYWYDSCGNQQGLDQYCSNGCYNNICQNYYNYNNNYNYNYGYNNYNNACSDYAYKLCQGNNIYWYNSCGNQQGIFQTCGANSTCQNGQCINTYTYGSPAQPTYAAHYYIKCNSNNLYWYDSVGSVNTLYKTCADSNSCTVDSCSTRSCINTLKCDGSTCATGSADYVKYCQSGSNNSNNNNNNNNSNNTGAISGLSLSFVAKTDATSSQWQKTIQVNQNSTAYFMVSLVNNGTSAIDNLNISANIPGQITSVGNLMINGTATSGDIISGINIGSLTPGTTKTIAFEGKTQGFSMQASTSAVVIANSNGASQSDSLAINFNPSSVAAASVSSSQNSIGFLDFLKRWYLWILVGLVLIFLFVVVFRRLSSNS